MYEESLSAGNVLIQPLSSEIFVFELYLALISMFTFQNKNMHVSLFYWACGGKKTGQNPMKPKTIRKKAFETAMQKNKKNPKTFRHIRCFR